MTMKKIIERNIAEHIAVLQKNETNLVNSIELFAREIVASLASGGCIFWCGNGGSASDSQHMAGELIGRFKKNRKPLKSLALTADSSVMTCISNDFTFDDVFSRQVEGLARPNDLLIGISTSGNSRNVLNAIIKANQLGLTTLALLGNDGGEIFYKANKSIVINSNNTARIQEMHIMLGHILCELVEDDLKVYY